MLFNSLEFFLFLPAVFLLYWFVFNRNLWWQNLFVVVVSYVFYGWWDWKFLILIALTSFCSWLSGIWMGEQEQETCPVTGLRGHRRFVMVANIVLNLGILGYFKYYNFFVESFIQAFSGMGIALHPNTLKIILPVGISFYTFQALSYSIDVYRGNIKPTKDMVAFFAYVSFFPQLVAGPIERATNLLPQFLSSRNFSYPHAVDGCRQMLWGMFKKVVIADQCAIFANQVFDNYTGLNGSTLVLGVLFFTFQIYGDFSGYSDIAIGSARLFGFKLMRNFAYPYFSRDIAEFWRKWHISLSTWFRDYVYIPLGGSRVPLRKQIRNIFIIFGVSGFWHGANWTFIFWGILHAIYFLPLLLTNKNRNNLDIVAKGGFFPSFKELWGMGTTFSLVMLAWIFFRAESVNDAFSYIAGMFSLSLFSMPEIRPLKFMALLMLFLFAEWLGRDQEFALAKFGVKWPKVVRHFFYYSLIILILLNTGSGQDFIYFQF